MHTLVVELFLPPRPIGQIVRHKDGNARNNVYANLTYGTHADNSNDRNFHGTHQRGERNPSAKLTWAVVDRMREMYAEGGKTQLAVAKIFCVPESTTSNILAGRTWVKK